MSLDPRTPVLVGVGAITQRCEDPREAREPVELMIAALERAADDAGNRALLRQAKSIRIPRGFWDYADAGRIIAQRFGATEARTQVLELGILQTTPFGLAAEAIASGAEDIVLVTGAEAKYRALRAQVLGVDVPFTVQSGVEPDNVLKPERELWNAMEADFGLMLPVNQYALMETALRHAEGMSIAAHRRDVARVWADFSRVGAANPDAWNRDGATIDELLGGSRSNRMLAFPYAKLHNSQWNVDQAAGLILCSVAAARAAGIPEDKWVFPLVVADANRMTPLSERAEMHRSYGFRAAGQQALAHAGLSIADVAHLELYSCFPVAVRVQARELAVPAERPLTVTGGMPFAGGPLNNFVLQALVRMAQVLRADRGSVGMATAVSGMLTKQGVSLWSSAPPASAFKHIDATAQVVREMQTVTIDPDYSGRATIATYTVLYAGDAPIRAVAICDTLEGKRTIAATQDAALCAAMTTEEHCGRSVRIDAEHVFSVSGA